MPILDQYSSTGLNCFSLFFRKKKMSAYPLNNAIARIQSSVLLFGVSDAVLRTHSAAPHTCKQFQRDTYPALRRVHGSQAHSISERSIWYHLWRKKGAATARLLPCPTHRQGNADAVEAVEPSHLGSPKAARRRRRNQRGAQHDEDPAPT
jgi:hypothetical protein